MTLQASEWQKPAPECPNCLVDGEVPMAQDFKPFGIGGSARSKAVKIAETIAAEDYGATDFHAEGREGHGARPSYGGTPTSTQQSTWGMAQSVLPQAIELGRENRLRYGDPLAALQKNIKAGVVPDILAQSRKRSFKW